jgi:hypothetical protein
MMMGNPYMKVVKHHDAAKDAIKDPIIRSLFTYVELPMSQRMAVYFDSWAENTIVDAFSGIGQALSATPALMGIGGIVGGMFSSSDSYILYML